MASHRANLINTISNICLVIQSQSNGLAVFNLVWTYAIKEVDGRKKHTALAMVLLGADKSVYLTVPTPMSRPYVFTHILLTCHCQKSPPIWHGCVKYCCGGSPTMSGLLHSPRYGISRPCGLHTKAIHPFPMAMSFQSCQLCRDTQRHHICGRYTRTRSSTELVSSQRHMNHACILE